MEPCTICQENSMYACAPCKLSLCENHKTVHEKETSSDHIVAHTKVILNFKKISIIATNILTAMNMKYKSDRWFMEEIKEVILKISNSYKQTSNSCNTKRKITTPPRVTIKSFRKTLKEFSRLARASHCTILSISDFQILSEYYKFNNISKISSRDIPDSNTLLSANDNLFFLESHSSNIQCIAVSNDNAYIITSSFEENVRIWSLPDRTQEYVISDMNSIVHSITISVDNTLIVFGCSDGIVRIWSLHNKWQVAVLVGHKTVVRSVAITRDNRFIVSCSQDRTLRIWNLEQKLF